MMKSWADHCSSDDESDDGLHPARLAVNSGDAEDNNGIGYSNDVDLSFDESIEHISVTGEDDLDNLVGNNSDGGRGGNYAGKGGTERGGNYAGKGGTERGGNRRNGNNEKVPYPEPIDFDNLPPDLPKQAPFTACIRNLSYKIDTPADLADKIEGLTRWRYHKKLQVEVVNARLGTDQRTGKPMGYGYVEFGTSQEVRFYAKEKDLYIYLYSMEVNSLINPQCSKLRYTFIANDFPQSK